MTRGRAGTPVRPTPWPQSSTSPLGSPIQPSVVYDAEGPAQLEAVYEGAATGYTYAREGHPNADVLAAAIDALEGLDGGLAVSSGMAAVSAVMLALLRAGDHVVGASQLYGRSMRMLQEDLPRLGIATSLADATDAAALAAAIRPETRLVLVEVVSNPMLRVADLAAATEIAHRAGALLAVDNTFTTPFGLRPAAFGADVVIHSVTKLLAGHSDATLGYVGARDAVHRAALRTAATTFGLTASPFDCWLAERGLHTAELRFARAQTSAAALAEALAGHPAVARVVYPSRSDHPDHARARSLLGDGGGTMVTFDLAGGRPAAERFARAAGALPFAPTLGDVATTLSHPCSSSHRGMSAQARAALGIGEGTFRVSLGIEDPDWILETLHDALGAS
jgi:cystathionine gamma-synthase